MNPVQVSRLGKAHGYIPQGSRCSCRSCHSPHRKRRRLAPPSKHWKCMVLFMLGACLKNPNNNFFTLTNQSIKSDKCMAPWWCLLHSWFTLSIIISQYPFGSCYLVWEWPQISMPCCLHFGQGDSHLAAEELTVLRGIPGQSGQGEDEPSQDCYNLAGWVTSSYPWVCTKNRIMFAFVRA